MNGREIFDRVTVPSWYLSLETAKIKWKTTGRIRR